MQFLRVSALLSAVTMAIASLSGCGKEEPPQITDPDGFYQGEPANKFNSAIFDVSIPAPGRRVTYVVLGHDSDLCEKIQKASRDGVGSVHFNGPIVGTAWTGNPVKILPSALGPKSERAKVLSTGIPNSYTYDAAFRSDSEGKLSELVGSRHTIFVESNDGPGLRGRALFGGEAADHGSLKFMARECPGLSAIVTTTLGKQ